MISIVATATRIFAMHALHPEIQWWQQFSMRMWLDLLLYQAVCFHRVVLNRAKRSVFLVAIRAGYTVDGVLCVSWGRAMSSFKMWFSRSIDVLVHHINASNLFTACEHE